jgi:phosphatidylglycerophosphatase C
VADRLVVFDLDGTLTYHDSFVPYVMGFCRRRPWLFLRFVLLLPAVIAFVLRLKDHGAVKSAVIQQLLKGRTRAEIDAWTAHFVPGLIERGMRPEALAVLEKHRAAGDRLVLLSASPDLYVPAIGEHLGFGEVLCTEVQWNAGRLDGRLTTANRRGDEKTRLVQALQQAHPDLKLVAYANGPSDIDHLALADEKLLVNAPPWLCLKAKHLGIPSGHWR